MVGVVKDIRLSNDFSQPTMPESYIPFSQSPSRAMTIVLRSDGDRLPLIAGLREAVASLDPYQPLSQLVSLSQLVNDQEAPYRIFTEFCNFFGLLALFLAAIGIYGVMAFIVSGRIKEIGIRMALGATPREVTGLILAHSVRLTFVGIILGLAGAAALAQMLAGMLVGVSVTDPGIYLGAAASWAPRFCWRVTFQPAEQPRVDPMVALRHE